jgi:hypothetical protein
MTTTIYFCYWHTIGDPETTELYSFETYEDLNVFRTEHKNTIVIEQSFELTSTLKLI